MMPRGRACRVLLMAYPKNHRDEYGEPIAQMMRDRIREEGGGLRTVVVVAHLLADITKSAFHERMETVMDTIKAGWWRVMAALIAIVIAGATIPSIGEPATGPWWKNFFGTAALLTVPLVIGAGLLVHRRHQRHGSMLVVVGVLPGCAALVLFWHPVFLLFGLCSISVLIAAINDVDRINRASRRLAVNDVA